MIQHTTAPHTGTCPDPFRYLTAEDRMVEERAVEHCVLGFLLTGSPEAAKAVAGQLTLDAFEGVHERVIARVVLDHFKRSNEPIATSAVVAAMDAAAVRQTPGANGTLRACRQGFHDAYHDIAEAAAADRARGPYIYIDRDLGILLGRLDHQRMSDDAGLLRSAIEQGLHDEARAIITRMNEIAVTPQGSRAVFLADLELDPALDPGPDAIKTGFVPVDVAVGGLHPGELMLILGTTGLGKSLFSMQLAAGAVLRDESVSCLWFCGEMDARAIRTRVLSFASRVNTRELALPTLPAPQHLAKQRGLESLHGIASRFGIVESPITINVIEEHVRRHKPSIIVADYLQLVGTDLDGEERERLDDVAQRLSNLAKQYGVAVILPSAMAKARDGQVKGSNGVDYIAETRFLGERIASDDGEQHVRWTLSKNRHGPAGVSFDCRLDGDGQRFVPTGAA